jgi:S-adenosyl methyltransferase
MASGAGEKIPPGIDISRPHSARMYDYFLGGKDNFAVDRATAELTLQRLPMARIAARGNREFLARAVGYLAGEAGIRQFLDIGTGLPSANNTHEVAQRIAPTSRVVYTDNDPLVLAHARALLTSSLDGRTAYIEADLREPEKILADPIVRETLDFTQPIALMLISVLHFIADSDDPAGILATLLDALPPGSFLAASHISPEHNPVGIHSLEDTYREAGVTVKARTAEEFGRLVFTGLDLVDPGVVLVTEWRQGPDDVHPPAPSEINGYGAVGRKPLDRQAPPAI